MNPLETPFNYEIVSTHTATQYSIELRDLILHKEVSLVIHLSNEYGFIFNTIQYKIEGEEYNQWGDDDSYIEIIVQREVQKLSKRDLNETI